MHRGQGALKISLHRQAQSKTWGLLRFGQPFHPGRLLAAELKQAQGRFCPVWSKALNGSWTALKRS